jgi:DnaK suppressor protein
MRRIDPRRVLEAKRQQTLSELQHRLHGAREEWTWNNDVRDTADSSEMEGREDIELELIRLNVDTLQRIDQALSRVDQGTYGLCADCRSTVSAARLRALPFAVRCRTCEEEHERAQRAAPGGRGAAAIRIREQEI